MPPGIDLPMVHIQELTHDQDKLNLGNLLISLCCQSMHPPGSYSCSERLTREWHEMVRFFFKAKTLHLIAELLKY